MKKFLTSALIVALTIGTAQAQTNQGQHHGHRKEHQMPYSQLNLSTEQKASMQKINEDFKKQMNELKKQDQLTVAEMKNRRQALQEQHRSNVEAILTPAQREQLSRMKANGKNRNMDGRSRVNKEGQAFGNRGADLEKELNLTADQQQKVDKLQSDLRAKVQTLRSDNSVTQDQKKEKMRELMKQHQEEMKSVLTNEQVEKMKSLRQENRARNTK